MRGSLAERLAAASLACSVCVATPAPAAEPIKVVASFSILGDLVERVGGEGVAVTTLVGADADAHVYEPTPGDARIVAAADVVVVNGLAFEGWLDRLIEASGYLGKIAIASAGIDTIAAGEAGDHKAETHGAVDPHAWQSIANARIYVKNIAAALCAAAADACADFNANADAYIAELDALDAEIRRGFAAVPPARRKLITSHDAFAYFADSYGIEVLAAQGASTESEASAGDVAALIEQIREAGVSAVFVETISDPRLIAQIARETDARLGGALYSDALSGPAGPAPTYLDMMRHNARLLQEAWQGS